MSDDFGAGAPKLEFGLMRLPKQGDRIDIPRVEQMVDRFREAGFAYFDTALDADNVSRLVPSICRSETT